MFGVAMLGLSTSCQRWDLRTLERREFYIMKPGQGEREGLTADEALVLATDLAKPAEGRRHGRGAVTIKTPAGTTLVLAHRLSINDFVKRWSKGAGLGPEHFGKYEVRFKHEEVHSGKSAGAALLVAEQLAWREESESLSDIRITGPDLNDYLVVEKEELDSIFDNARKFETWKFSDLEDRYKFAARLLVEYHVEAGEIDDKLADLEKHADAIQDSKTKQVAIEIRKMLDRVNEYYEEAALDE